MMVGELRLLLDGVEDSVDIKVVVNVDKGSVSLDIVEFDEVDDSVGVFVYLYHLTKEDVCTTG